MISLYLTELLQCEVNCFVLIFSAVGIVLHKTTEEKFCMRERPRPTYFHLKYSSLSPGRPSADPRGPSRLTSAQISSQPCQMRRAVMSPSSAISALEGATTRASCKICQCNSDFWFKTAIFYFWFLWSSQHIEQNFA